MIRVLASFRALLAALLLGATSAALAAEPPVTDVRIEAGARLTPVGYALTSSGRLLIAGNDPAPGIWSVAPDGSVERLPSPLADDAPIKLTAEHRGELWLLTEASVLYHRASDGVWSRFPIQQPPPLPPGCADCSVSSSWPVNLVALGPGRAAVAGQLLVSPGERRYFTDVTVVDEGRATRHLLEGKGELAATTADHTVLVFPPMHDTRPGTLRTVTARGIGEPREAERLGGVDHVADAAGNLWFHNVNGLHLLRPDAESARVVGRRGVRVLATGPAVSDGVWALLADEAAQVQAVRFASDDATELEARTFSSGRGIGYGSWQIAERHDMGLTVTSGQMLHRSHGGGWTRYALGRWLDATQARADEQAQRTRIQTFAPWLRRLHPGGVTWLFLCLALGARLASARVKGAVKGRWPQAILGAGFGAVAGLLLAPIVRLGSGWYQNSSSMGIDLNDPWWGLARLAMMGGLAWVGLRLSLAPHRRATLLFLALVAVLAVVGAIFGLRPHGLISGISVSVAGAAAWWLSKLAGAATSRRTPPAAGRSRA